MGLLLACLFLFPTKNVAASSSSSLQGDKTANEGESTFTIKNIKLNRTQYDLVKGKSFKLKVNNLPSTFMVTYSSENSKIATVNSSGRVSGKKNGTVKITATIRSNNKIYRKLSCNVTVGPAAVSVVVSRSRLNLSVGEKRHISISVKPYNTVETPKFKSSNKNIASVSSSGLITAKAPGTATITATIANKKSAVCTVTVTKKTSPSTQVTGSPAGTSSPKQQPTRGVQTSKDTTSSSGSSTPPKKK